MYLCLHRPSPCLVYFHSVSQSSPKWLSAKPGELVWTRIQRGFYMQVEGAIIIATVRARKWGSRREKASGAHTPMLQNTTCLWAVLYNNMLSPLRLLPVEKLISYSPWMTAECQCRMLQQERSPCSLGLTPNPDIYCSCFMFSNFLLLLNAFVYSYNSNAAIYLILWQHYLNISLIFTLRITMCSGNVMMTLTLYRLPCILAIVRKVGRATK